MKVKINGREKEVISIVVKDSIVRVIQRIDGSIESTDYTIDDNYEIDLGINSKEVKYDIDVRCTYKCSRENEFIGVIGRYRVKMLKKDSIVIEDDDDWIELSIDKRDISKVSQLMKIGNGTVYVEVNDFGLGRIIDKER